MSEYYNRKTHLLLGIALATDAVCWRPMQGVRNVCGWIGRFE
jgi:hypothetical protein